MNINMHNTTGSIHFMWDLSQDAFNKMAAPIPNHGNDVSDYMGSVFFGKFKLEFICNDIAGVYCNMFEYGAEDNPDSAYSYLDDGTPYEERYPISDEIYPQAFSSFDSFAADIEEQIIDVLDKHPDLIPVAMQPTVTDEWYPCGHPYKPTITRVA